MGGARTGDLQPTRGEVKRHSHLSIGRYHQHSVDVLDESMRVLDFFMHTWAPCRAKPNPPAQCSRISPCFLAMAGLVAAAFLPSSMALTCSLLSAELTEVVGQLMTALMRDHSCEP